MLIVIILLFILQVHAQCDGDSAGFIDPVDQEITVGTPTTFNCSYCNTFGVHISWIINDQGLNQVLAENMNPCVRSQAPNTGNPSVLNMIAGSKQCNGTKVKCVAIYEDGQHDPPMVNSTVAVLTVLDLEEVEKLELKKFNNGSILLTWDAITITTVTSTSLHYQIEISISQDNILNIPVPSNSTQTKLNYHFMPDNPSVCNIYTIYVTPILDLFSSPRIGINASLYEEISSIPFVNLNSVSLVNSSSLEYVITLHDAVPVCTFTLNIVNDFTNSLHSIERKRPDDNSVTNTLVFQVNAMELPFNERYTASMTLNGANNSENVTEPVKLSTYDILNVSRDLNITFVANTAAQGAFVVVFNGENYTYIPIQREADQFRITLEEEMQSQNNCNILFYDIERDGQLNLTAKELRPAFEIEEYSCIVENNDIDLGNSSVSADVYIGNDYVRFECHGSISDVDLMGCVTIIHNNSDYSTMYVDTLQTNSTMTVSLDIETNHSFAVFPWRTTGLIGSKKICIQVKNDDTAENPLKQNLLIIILPVVFCALLVIVIIVVVNIVTLVVIRSKKPCKVSCSDDQENISMSSVNNSQKPTNPKSGKMAISHVAEVSCSSAQDNILMSSVNNSQKPTDPKSVETKNLSKASDHQKLHC